MADQLTLFGLWEAVSDPEPAEPPVEAPVVSPVVDDPLQTDLFSGSHVGFNQALTALGSLDADALRAAADAFGRRYPEHEAPPRWRAWASTLASKLAGEPSALADLAVGDLTVRFEGIGRAMADVLRPAVCRRAAERLIEVGGPGARTSDGRPAARLLVMAGDPTAAVRALERAVAAGDESAAVRVELARALGAVGRLEAALHCWRDALLLDPASADETELATTRLVEALDEAAELELPGDARAWVPALADLLHLATMPIRAADQSFEDQPGRLAGLLARYRAARAAGAPDALLLALKREMIVLAPSLRERVRRL